MYIYIAIAVVVLVAIGVTLWLTLGNDKEEGFGSLTSTQNITAILKYIEQNRMSAGNLTAVGWNFGSSVRIFTNYTNNNYTNDTIGVYIIDWNGEIREVLIRIYESNDSPIRVNGRGIYFRGTISSTILEPSEIPLQIKNYIKEQGTQGIDGQMCFYMRNGCNGYDWMRMQDKSRFGAGKCCIRYKNVFSGRCNSRNRYNICQNWDLDKKRIN